MITKEQMLKILAIIKVAYPRFDDFRDSNKLAAVNELWYRHFRGCDTNVLQEAIHRHIDKSVFPPTIAEIRSEYRRLIDKIPSAEEAWNCVLQNIRNFGSYRVTEGMSSLDEMSRQVVSKIGGYNRLCMAENREAEKLKEHFCKTYDVEKDAVLDKLMISDTLSLEVAKIE